MIKYKKNERYSFIFNIEEKNTRAKINQFAFIISITFEEFQYEDWFKENNKSNKLINSYLNVENNYKNTNLEKAFMSCTKREMCGSYIIL